MRDDAFGEGVGASMSMRGMAPGEKKRFSLAFGDFMPDLVTL
jgi:hypothetical protein